MNRKWTVLLLVLTLTLFAVACGKKKVTPVAPQDNMQDATTTTQVDPKPTVDTGADRVETPPELSIQELQRDLESRGLIGDVYFDYDRYELLPEARERLARNAEFMNSSEGQGLTFTLEGHCDERGTNEYNIALGQRRATAALDYITSLGVDGSRFKTISFGEERPFCTESNESCWQKNRRARFVITGRS